jgi:hypothetical protein
MDSDVQVTPHGNGFVIRLIGAIHQGLLLRLGPDEVWTAIVSQFSVCAHQHLMHVPGLDFNHNKTIIESLSILVLQKPA